MKAKSNTVDGYVIYAVSGTNTVSFAIDFRAADTNGLLGFAVERLDPKTKKWKYKAGYKVFRGTPINPKKETEVSTYNHPVQSFVWDDFACYDDTKYEYRFHPLKGTPGNIDRAARYIPITIKTEKLFTNGEHDIFFNRGVASSQAYSNKFDNLPPDKIKDPKRKQEALDWLSRHLDEAILKFINNAKKGETLLGCFYEFRYEPVAKAFKEAIDRGVKVQLIIDAKENGKDKEASFPRKANLTMLKKVDISTKKSDGYVILREAKKNDIQHNKFIVLLGRNQNAKEVWMGSTNISMGGIHGQTNVGHWIRNTQIAEKYLEYWQVLSSDPGAKTGDTRAEGLRKNNQLKERIEQIQPNLEFTNWDEVPLGITPYFSPRSGLSVLESYVTMFDSAAHLSCVTLAFGINKIFKDYLEDNNADDHISFLLLEKEDKPNPKSKDPFRYINAKQNVYKAWGSYINDPLYRWTRETTTRKMSLNEHVAYIHSKFLLVDPLGNDPVVITGSANFSAASTNDNDENMVIIRGNTRVADIYFTEFNRLFNHYYFRAIYEKLSKTNGVDKTKLELAPNDSWIGNYAEGKLRYKRVMMFTTMEGV